MNKLITLLSKKPILLIGFIGLASFCHGQNLISPDSWTIGSGSVGIFGKNGGTTENVREWGEAPNGQRAILWKAIPDANNDADGGWTTSTFNIDHTKMYRFSVWIKKTNSTDGNTYIGCNSYPDPVLRMDGTPNSNPYFWNGDLPELDKWYLLVGYIHGSGDNSTTSYGAMYDGETGKKVGSMGDYKFPATATTARHRTYLYYDTNTSDRQYFYAPRVDMVTGDEAPIASLGFAPGAFLKGDVAIGENTTVPTGYKLAVGGSAIMEEIKIASSGNWPDYVFTDTYQLNPLSEVSTYIQENHHLPGIPTAEEVAENGIKLGEMNAKLLEKVEELTLYLIEMKGNYDSEIDRLKNENNDFKANLERQQKEIEELKLNKK